MDKILSGIFSISCSRHDFHKHKCEPCGTVWEHPNKCDGQVSPHMCPNCGEEEWYKLISLERPTVTNGLDMVHPLSLWEIFNLIIKHAARRS
jgi:NAD-dependent SIR2 family protein deacetylase